MSTILKTIFLFQVLLFFFSCGKNPARTDSSGKEETFKKETFTLTDEIYEKPADGFKNWASSQEIYCEKDCPEAIATVWNGSGKTFGFCSGFLIQDDIVVTNRHCIPSGLKYNGANCSESMQISFLDKAGERLDYDCSEVLWVSSADEKKLKGVDLAYLKLKESAQIEPVNIQWSEPFHFSQVEIWKVDFQKGSKRYLIDSEQCSLEPIRPPQGRENLLLEDCSIQHGNSGGLIWNGADKALGAIFAFFDEEEAAKLDLEPYTGLGSSFECVCPPNELSCERKSFCE